MHKMKKRTTKNWRLVEKDNRKIGLSQEDGLNQIK